MPEIQLRTDHAYLGYRLPSGVLYAVNDATVGLRGGQLTLLSGPSGSGKTSLLLLLACLLQPDSGEVFVNDEPMSRLTESARVSIRQRQIGFISQTGRLLGSLNVLQNVAAALEIGVAPEARSRERAIEALSKVSLEAKADLRPADLSRSERHLVAIARALVRNPQILLADEATAPLDSRAGVQIGELLAGFAANNHLVVLTSRDPSWATYASRCIRIASGRIEADEELG